MTSAQIQRWFLCRLGSNRAVNTTRINLRIGPLRGEKPVNSPPYPPINRSKVDALLDVSAPIAARRPKSR